MSSARLDSTRMYATTSAVSSSAPCAPRRVEHAFTELAQTIEQRNETATRHHAAGSKSTQQSREEGIVRTDFR